MIVYGIKNCNTVKKALDWLTENKIDFQFHDYKKLGISRERIVEWQQKVAWESLINKRGTTWRKLTPELQASIVDEAAAVKLMQEHTSLIKRPILESGELILLGFTEEEYQQNFDRK